MSAINSTAAFSRFALCSLLAFTSTLSMNSAVAGAMADELTSCMLRNASSSERFDTAFVTWVAASYHPSMPPELRVPIESKQLIYRRVGKLLDRLLAEACTVEARKAVASEGQAGLASALHAFWQSGTAELNQSKEATSTFSEIWSYADGKKISQALRSN